MIQQFSEVFILLKQSRFSFLNFSDIGTLIDEQRVLILGFDLILQ